MSTATISNSRTVTMNHTMINKKATWIERFKKYILNNAAYFAASSAMMTGNSSAAVQIIKNARS